MIYLFNFIYKYLQNSCILVGAFPLAFVLNTMKIRIYVFILHFIYYTYILDITITKSR